MSEDYEYEPAKWSAKTTFKSARAAYKKKVVDAAPSRAKLKGPTKADALPKELTTDCAGPVLISIDHTGSMGDWAAIVRGKLGYLDHEMRTEYRGEDVETCFLSIGDAHEREPHALQVRPFVSGGDMVKELEVLDFGGGRRGGGGLHETYELGALYLSRKFKAPKSTMKPVVIFIGDEMCYPAISPAMARDYCGIDLKRPITTEQAFRDLRTFCSVYAILKPYRVRKDSDGTPVFDKSDPINEQVYLDWVELLGAGYVAPLPIPEDVVNVIFGILAREVDKVGYFKDEIDDRQKDVPERLKTVYTALHDIHKDAPKGVSDDDVGKSKIVRGMLPGKTKRTKRLI